MIIYYGTTKLLRKLHTVSYWILNYYNIRIKKHENLIKVTILLKF